MTLIVETLGTSLNLGSPKADLETKTCAQGAYVYSECKGCKQRSEESKKREKPIKLVLMSRCGQPELILRETVWNTPRNPKTGRQGG